jgi:hypothetical protein
LEIKHVLAKNKGMMSPYHEMEKPAIILRSVDRAAISV